MRPPRGRALSAAAGLVILAWTVWGLGLSPRAALVALVTLGLALLPPGLLLVRLLPRVPLWPGERLALALLLGYPAFAALYWLSAVLSVRRFYPVLMLALAGVALAALRRDRRLAAQADAPETEPRAGGPHWSLPLLIPLVLLVALRGGAPFTLLADGTLRYDHSMDHSLHLAFYWELLRGTPPEQIPALAGMPFPRYHLLAFMPGLLLADVGGLQVSTVYHLVSPLLRLMLLMAAVYLAVRLRTGDGRLATAAVAAVVLIAEFLAVCLEGRFLEYTTPLYFFIRSESGGGGIVVWGTIAALTALYDRAHGRDDPRSGRALYLAGTLAGLSFSFKAQIFVLLGLSLAVVLAVRALRARSLAHVCALALMGAASLALLGGWRGEGDPWQLYWTPGALVEHYVYPVLAADPSPMVREGILGFFRSVPLGLGWVAATPLTLWRLVAFSPLVLLFVLSRLRRFGAVSLTDAWLALAFPVSLVAAYFISVRELTGEVTPYEVLQATTPLAVIGAAANVVVLAALLQRRRVDAPRVVVWGVILSSLVAGVALLARPPFVPDRTGILIRPDEQCALRFLRERTPFDAVVASDRTDSLPELRGTGKRFNHQAVIAGLAGRRSVLEYYGKDTDPGRNRQRSLRQLFSTDDVAAARQVLAEFDVDHVLEYAGHPLRIPAGELELLFAHGGTRVFTHPTARHRRPPFRPAAEAWLPGFLREPSDLSCGPAAPG